MTIELGFASFKLSTGEDVGIIDVPGHERFIKTMISGVGSLDMVVFVIAADDGWMPQSEEHLAILRYLGLQRGIIVLTKVDLTTPEWTELVKGDLRSTTAGTFLQDCPIIEFSKVDERNLVQIRTVVESILKSLPRRSPMPSARLFVDRAFSLAGSGTVVTGTLREGIFTVGQEVYHHPSGEKTRIRSLESFYSELENANPGIRLAVGLQSLAKGEVARGDLLFHPKKLTASSHLGIKFWLEDRSKHHIKHNREILFLHGTAEVSGRITLPSTEVRAADGAIVACLKLDEPVIAKTGDRFIVRLPTPSILVGGGIVIDNNAFVPKRADTASWILLAGAATMTLQDLIRYQLAIKKIVIEDDLLFQSLFMPFEINEGLKFLIDHQAVIKNDKSLILKKIWDEAETGILQEVERFHQNNPHLEAIPLAELQSKVEVPVELFEIVVASLIVSNRLKRHAAGIKLQSYTASLSGDLETSKKRILADLRDVTRPTLNRNEIFQNYKNGREIYGFLKEQGVIIDIGGTVYLKEIFDKFSAFVVGYLKKNLRITIAEARDLTCTSRAVILPILEELDRQRITRREGDYRRLCD